MLIKQLYTLYHGTKYMVRIVRVEYKDPVLVRIHKLYLMTKYPVPTLLRSSSWLYLRNILSTRSKCLDLNSHLEPAIDSDT